MHLIYQEKSLVQNEYKMLKKLRNNGQELYQHGFSDIVNYSEDGKLYSTTCYETKNVSKHFELGYILVLPSSRLKWSEILELRQGSYNKVEILENLLRTVGPKHFKYIFYFKVKPLI